VGTIKSRVNRGRNRLAEMMVMSESPEAKPEEFFVTSPEPRGP
jgi:hypothetical protein